MNKLIAIMLSAALIGASAEAIKPASAAGASSRMSTPQMGTKTREDQRFRQICANLKPGETAVWCAEYGLPTSGDEATAAREGKASKAAPAREPAAPHVTGASDEERYRRICTNLKPGETAEWCAEYGLPTHGPTRAAANGRSAPPPVAALAVPATPKDISGWCFPAATEIQFTFDERIGSDSSRSHRCTVPTSALPVSLDVLFGRTSGLPLVHGVTLSRAVLEKEAPQLVSQFDNERKEREQKEELESLVRTLKEQQQAQQAQQEAQLAEQRRQENLYLLFGMWSILQQQQRPVIVPAPAPPPVVVSPPPQRAPSFSTSCQATGNSLYCNTR